MFPAGSTWTHSTRREALAGDFGELPLERRRREGFAAETAAADRAAADRKVQPRIGKRRQDRLLDLIERERPARHAMRELFECARGLADGALQGIGRTARSRIMIDDRAQDERVIGVQPERDLFVPRQLVGVDVCELVDVPVQPPAVALERAVIDVSAADVGVENEVERPERCGWFLRVCDGEQRKRRYHEVAYGCSRTERG